MKNSIYILVFLLVPFFFFSQENLVPNGNFESGNYNGGTNPTGYYSGVSCNQGNNRFNNDVSSWNVAKPSPLFLSPCSPDWIPGGMTIGEGMCPASNSYYIRSASKRESIVVGLKNGYKLKKGQTYKFRIKYRQPIAWDQGTGSFQVVFSTDEDGLRVSNSKNKWVAVDFYDGPTCDWKYYETYFTVPNDNNKKYEDMKYLVLQYNHEINEYWNEPNGSGSASLVWNYDDVFLAESQKCEDIKYIQDWQYVNVNKIEQANVQIRAGAHVSPYSWPANNPVIVKSSSKVIYRAPSVYLEPGFFVEEPGSYFETQVGTCVNDPCPTIPTFSTPPVVNCNTPIQLGNSIAHVPGVFYVWQPESAFESPWSSTTNFSPPTGNGCLDAKLTMWTICGQSQTVPFTIKYFDGPPTVTLSNVNHTSWAISFNLNITNANTYTVQCIDATTGAVIYEDFKTVTCKTSGTNINVNINQCNLDLCRNIILKVIAHNDCHGQVIKTQTLNKPIVPNPQITVTNLNSTNFDFRFNVPVSSNYEYVIVETWNENMTQLVCSKTYSRCGTPITGSTLFYNIKDCIGSCPNACRNYKVKIRMKNYCNSNEAVQVVNWNKTSTTFSMPSSYPNIITLNGDGINEMLCFTPTAADYFEIVVVDRWGNKWFEASGCVQSSPICLWNPPSNINDGVYYYTIKFSNQCGNVGTQHSFVHVYNSLKMGRPSEPEIRSSLIENIESNIYVFPNPTEDNLNILSKEPIFEIELLDNNGRRVFNDLSVDKSEYNLSVSHLVAGVYTLKVKSVAGIFIEKVIKK